MIGQKQITWEDEEEWVAVRHHDEHDYRAGVQYHRITVQHVGTMLELTADGAEMPRPSGMSGIGPFPARRRLIADKIDHIVPDYDEVVVIYRCDAEIPELDEIAAEVKHETRVIER
jgi:hypothetical protein